MNDAIYCPEKEFTLPEIIAKFYCSAKQFYQTKICSEEN